ncbi:MAG: nucleotidyl transferase AbiEii/AbiGii toxin family protein [Thermoguttaceae bacterium]|jgi:hypothetical protein
MDRVAKLPASDRSDLFREVAARRGNLTAALVEKDFWVCWALKHLFAMENVPAGIIFKGGTSLSKAFNAINRFSEDVDLSLSRDDLGFGGDKDPRNAPSRKKSQQWIEALEAKCKQAIRDQLLPALRNNFTVVLGEVGRDWLLAIDNQDAQAVNFVYPRGLVVGGEAVPVYVQPRVRLELGARSDQWPAGDQNVQSYAAEVFPNMFEQPVAIVRTLNAERTFWEKVMILHAEYHRSPSSQMKKRLSRHYYDVHCLAQGEIGRLALQKMKLLQDVIRHKMKFFECKWANYETAIAGTLHLVPPDDRYKELQWDYSAMSEMFFSEPPPFGRILETLRSLEERINSSKREKLSRSIV